MGTIPVAPISGVVIHLTQEIKAKMTQQDKISEQELVSCTPTTLFYPLILHHVMLSFISLLEI